MAPLLLALVIGVGVGAAVVMRGHGPAASAVAGIVGFLVAVLVLRVLFSSTV